MSAEFVEGPVDVDYTSPPADPAEIEVVADENEEGGGVEDTPELRAQYAEYQRQEAAKAQKLEIDQKEWNRLQYERRTQAKTLSELNQKVEFMTNIIRQNAQAQIQAQQAEQMPDPDDVAGQLKYELAQVKEFQRQQAEFLKQQAEERIGEETLRKADNHIAEFANQAPEVYTAAMTHLANVVKNDLEQKFPHLSEEERQSIGAEAIANRKRDIVRRGGHVGEEFFKQSMVYGFNPGMVQSQAPQVAQKKNGKDAIAQERKKSNTSLGGLGGAPAQKAPFSARDAKRTTESDYHKQMHELIQNKQVRTDKAGRVASMKDLLAGKGVSVG